MDPVIDKLLTDRAMGELSSEAAWLLEQYLAQHPEYRPLCRQTEETVRLARLALRDENAAGKPMLHVVALGRIGGFRVLRVVGQAAALAACVLFGVWIGAAATRPGSDPVAAGPQQTATASGTSRAISAAVLAADVSGPGFWSTQRWTTRRWQRVEPTGVQVIEWEGPFSPRWKRGVQ